MRVLYLIIAFLCASNAYFFVSKNALQNKLKLCQISSFNLKESLETQNQAIEKMKLDSKTYYKNEAKRNQQIITQIQAIPPMANKDGKTCEEALSYIIKLESL